MQVVGLIQFSIEMPPNWYASLFGKKTSVEQQRPRLTIVWHILCIQWLGESLFQVTDWSSTAVRGSWTGPCTFSRPLSRPRHALTLTLPSIDSETADNSNTSLTILVRVYYLPRSFQVVSITEVIFSHWTLYNTVQCFHLADRTNINVGVEPIVQCGRSQTTALQVSCVS